MSLQVSEGFKEAILGPRSFAQIFAGGAILVYSGLQPETANHAATGTLLAKITANGGEWAPGSPVNGLLFQQVGVWIRKEPTQLWQLTGAAAGVAGWFRLVENAGSGTGASHSHCRIDGRVSAVPDNDALRLSSVAINVGLTLTIDHFYYTLPPIIGA